MEHNLTNVFEPEYLDEFLLMWASAKFAVDNVDDDEEGIMWLWWFAGWDVEAPWAWGDATGDGDDDSDKLLDKDIAEPCREWDICPLDEVPVEEDEVNDDPAWTLFEVGTPWWVAAVNNWFEYNWSTAECIGNTASIIVVFIIFVQSPYIRIWVLRNAHLVFFLNYN